MGKVTDCSVVDHGTFEVGSLPEVGSGRFENFSTGEGEDFQEAVEDAMEGMKGEETAGTDWDGLELRLKGTWGGESSRNWITSNRAEGNRLYYVTILYNLETPQPEVQCDSCSPVMINSRFCHETGCRNSGKTWVPDRGEWVRFFHCRECDEPVEEGETCACQTPVEEELCECGRLPGDCSTADGEEEHLDRELGGGE